APGTPHRTRHLARRTPHRTTHSAPRTPHSHVHVHVPSLLFDCPGLPPAVVPAVRAYAVRWLGFVAMWAFAQADRRQGIVGSAVCRAPFRVSSFWIRHGVPNLKFFSSALSALQTADRPTVACSRTWRGSSGGRTAGTSHDSPRGRAASSEATGITV